MELAVDLNALAWIAIVAAVTPLVMRRLPGPRIPEVALLLVFGIVIGPQGLGLAEVDEAIQLLADIGLGFLFLMAGYEIELRLMRGATGRRAIGAWAASLAVSLVLVAGLAAVGYVEAYMAVAIALTSTALGTLLPFLRDSGQLGSPLGKAVMANGAIGEFGPILGISLLLGSQGALESLVVLIVFALVAYGISRLAGRLATERVRAEFSAGHDSTAQTAVRWTVLLLLLLLSFAADNGLDIVLGAFVAGIILRQTTGPEAPRLEQKLDGIAFGFFIPLFFIVSGMGMDVASIIDNPSRLVVFFLLIVLVRGLPALLAFRGTLPGRQPWQVALYTATGLPIIVAITQIGLETGVMLPENAAALVGAGLLTVLIFPALADRIGQRAASPAAESIR